MKDTETREVAEGLSKRNKDKVQERKILRKRPKVRKRQKPGRWAEGLSKRKKDKVRERKILRTRQSTRKKLRKRRCQR